MDHETALYQMNSEENLFWGGGGEGLLLFSEKVFSGKWELFHKKS